jgi:hypothetical protein
VLSLSYLGGAERHELVELLAVLTAGLEQLAGIRPLLFEHGTGLSRPRQGCCIEHAHLHVVPIGAPPQLRPRTRLLHRCEAILAAPGQLMGRDYLLVRPPQGPTEYYDASPLPSQHLRRVIGTATANDLWHWHDYLHLADRQEVTRALETPRRFLRSWVCGHARAAQISTQLGALA